MTDEQLGRGPCPECFNEHDATFQISRLRQERDDLREALINLCAAVRGRSGWTIAEGKALETADTALANLNKTDGE